MNARYRLARSARIDLQEISDYWMAEAGVEAAERLVDRLIETIRTISQHPRAGLPVERIGAGVRKFPSGRYLIYYRMNSRGIEVLHLLHGARNQMKALRARRPK